MQLSTDPAHDLALCSATRVASFLAAQVTDGPSEHYACSFSHCFLRVDLKLGAVLLPQPPVLWNYKSEPPYLAPILK